MKNHLLLFVLMLMPVLAMSQKNAAPKVLVVTAHPDDETTFPVTIYKITHDLKGTVDLALLTDGQGGFNGSELGSQYYGLNLTDSVIGRAHLPAIRKQELMNAGRIMGIRNYFFFDQVDDYYAKNPKPYISGQRWDMAYIEKRLDAILVKNTYDFILTLLPDSTQHGHHKTATLAALRAVQRYKGTSKPIVLGGYELDKNVAYRFEELPGYPETRARKNAPVYQLDRSAPFGHQNLLSYRIVSDWVIAEYKTQGDLQNNYIHQGELEKFWYYDLNGEVGLEKTRRLFEQLNSSGFSTPGQK
jgi:LmbE family N-acetylglucosaminyl deacetylase